jgi:hypothetical protein
MQQEFLLVSSKYPVARIKPFSGKVVKEIVPPGVKAPGVKAPEKDKKKGKSPDGVKKGPPERKVAFLVDDLKICVSDLAKHYKVQTDLLACGANCQYTHYKDLPAGLKATTVINKVTPIFEKLGMTEKQKTFFTNKIKYDSNFK